MTVDVQITRDLLANSDTTAGQLLAALVPLARLPVDAATPDDVKLYEFTGAHPASIRAGDIRKARQLTAQERSAA